MSGDIKMRKLWEKYLDSLSPTDRHKILHIAVGRLVDRGEIRFRMDDTIDLNGNLIPEDESMDEFLYWTASRKNLLDE